MWDIASIIVNRASRQKLFHVHVVVVGQAYAGHMWTVIPAASQHCASFVEVHTMNTHISRCYA